MSSLEDEIRDALRSEAARLREVRPLRLEPVPHRPGPVSTPRRARRLRPWLAPVTAAALVIALAIALVIVRTAQNAPAVPAAPQPTAPTTFPRYYVGFGAENNDGNGTSLVVGTPQAKTPMTTIPAPAGRSFEGTTLAAAADDRTFIVAETLGQRKPPYEPYPTDGPVAWYVVRISPGAANPVTMTRLPIPGKDADMPVMDAALSGDGRYLAVALGEASTTRQELQVYSVVTGRLLHTWSMVTANFLNYMAINTLTWINGDKTVAYSWYENKYWEVRTLAVNAPGTSLLAASHVAWSQYNPPPPHGVTPPGTPSECGLAITSQAVVVCESSVNSKTGVISPFNWLAHPFSSPGKPHVVAVIPPAVAKVTNAGGASTMVAYVSASEVIGFRVVIPRYGIGSATIHEFLATGHTVRQLGTGTIASPWVVW